MSRILVTGAAGFLGYHLAARLAADGHEVVAADNFVRGGCDQLFNDLVARRNVTFKAGDLAQQSFVAGIKGEFDTCYHLAALNGTQNFYERPWDVVWNCTVPTLNLLNTLVLSRRCGRFVYAGSSESYAGTVESFHWPVPTPEDIPLTIPDVDNPRWSYAASKLHGEVATMSAARQAGVDATILRYHNVYGPRMGDKHVVPDFFLRMLRGVYWIYGPEQTRSFFYIDDAIAATIGLANHAATVGEVVNVGSRREISVGELAEMMMRIAGCTGDITAKGAPRGSVSRRAPDLKKFRQFLPSSTEIPLEEGLAKTLHYYRANSGQFWHHNGSEFDGFLEAAPAA